MAESSLASSAASSYTMLIEFSFGEGFASKQRYCRYDQDIVAFGETWTSLPQIDIELPKLDGGMEDTPMTLEMPPESPIDKIQNGQAHSPITVAVYEASPDSPDTTKDEIFFGFMTEVSRSPGGASGLVQLTVASLKSLLDVPLGIPAVTTCIWQLGDGNCGIDLSTEKETGTALCAGRLVEVDGLTTITAQHWRKGFVSRDGLSIMVREQPTGNVLELVQPAPIEWIGQTVEVTPGCDKSASTCANKWNNIEHFSGVGLAIPSYNPLFETA